MKRRLIIVLMCMFSGLAFGQVKDTTSAKITGIQKFKNVKIAMPEPWQIVTNTDPLHLKKYNKETIVLQADSTMIIKQETNPFYLKPKTGTIQVSDKK